jgi:serine/threonine protein kinase
VGTPMGLRSVIVMLHADSSAPFVQDRGSSVAGQKLTSHQSAGAPPARSDHAVAAHSRAMVLSELKQYTVKERIGRGSFGEVYVVVHKATGAQCVLKQVRSPGALANPSCHARTPSDPAVSVCCAPRPPGPTPLIPSATEHSACAGAAATAAATARNIRRRK